MVAKALLLLSLQAPVVTANVNRTEVAYGDTLVLSIAVNARGTEWVRLSDPDLEGLEAYSSRQVSNVERVGEAEQRRTERFIFLRATRAGRATIGSVRVQQGRRVSSTEPIAITVTGAPPSQPGSNPIVASIMRRIPGPTGGEDVSIAIVPSSDTLYIGEQLDLLVVAWFPRSLRERLRTSPTMQPPEVRGAWTYPGGMTTEVLEQRRVNGLLYDLYAHHETVFPLSADGFSIDRATVSYNLPLTDSFMSRELRQVVQSRIPEVVLLDQPAGRSTSFSGSSAESLTMTMELSRSSLNVGEAAVLEVSLAGSGNVALWGEPALEWPAGLSGYPREAVVRTARVNGAITGTKVFSYLVVPDSIGSHTVTVSGYEYFDPSRGRYRALEPASASLVATSSGVAPRTAARALLPVPEATPLPAFLARLPLWAWFLLWLWPPLVVGGAKLLKHSRGRATPRAREQHERTTIWKLGEEFHAVLNRFVKTSDVLEGEALEEALVAAGVESKLASQAVRVKHRLGQANYGPDGVTDLDELRAEVDEVCRALAGDHRFNYRKRLETVIACLALLIPTTLAGQEDSAELLYGSRAYQTAVDSFTVRATNEPTRAANWFNLGNALFHSGEDSRALAAWIRAARLSPRDGAIRGTLRNTTAWRRDSRVPVYPVTASEAFIAALLAWSMGWLLALTRRKRTAAFTAFLGIALLAAAAGIRYRYDRPVGIVLTAETPLREAPYSSSESRATMDEGDAVMVRGRYGGWSRVLHQGVEGWVLSRKIERL